MVRISTLQTGRQALMDEASKDMTFDDPCNDDEILAEAASTYAYPEIEESASYSNLRKTNVHTMAFGTNGTPMNENKAQKSMLGPINELDQSSTNALLKLRTRDHLFQINKFVEVNDLCFSNDLTSIRRLNSMYKNFKLNSGGLSRKNKY